MPPGLPLRARHADHATGRDAASEPELRIIDLHHHLLPGIDDGPPDMAASVALARAAVAAGTDTVVATPHVSWDHPENTAERIGAGVRALRAALAADEVPLRVLAGAEVAAARAAELDEDELGALHLGGGPYLLVESPFAPTAAGLEPLLFSLLERGHKILLAHPERCPAFQREPERLVALVGRGILTQVTAGSLTGSFGRTVREVAHALLADGLVHVVASDAHSVDRRPPSVRAEVEREGYGALASWLCCLVPSAVLEGTPVPPRPSPARPPGAGLRRMLGR